MIRPHVIYLTDLEIYIYQLKFVQLVKDVINNIDVLGRFAWTSIFGAKKKVEKKTELLEYLENDKPHLVAQYKMGAKDAGAKKVNLQMTIEDGKWQSELPAPSTRDERTMASGLRSASPVVHGSKTLVASGTTIGGRSLHM